MTTTSEARPTLTPTTGDLVRSAQQGDSESYAELVARYEPHLRAVVRTFRLSSADGNDAIQLTWLRLVENIYRLREPDRLAGWLATTCRRECLRLVQARRREVPGAEELLADQADTRLPTPEAQVIDALVASEVRSHLARLSAPAQILLQTLTGNDTPTYAEVSRRLSIPIGGIGPSRGRYLRRLRAQLEQSGIHHGDWQ
jgi:RNA polymerase sigma factor (sigma-70 family)